MNRRVLNRELRKELLRLQSEQYRQALTREVQGFASFLKAPDATASGGSACGSAWMARIPLLAAVLLPNRWRRWLAIGLAVSKFMLLFSRQPH
ncbi:MAG: hypothetical protein H6R07_987 [Proteobacteria bacterium]|nr:hypothetical protein [Pseudomonadota bacterium]